MSTQNLINHARFIPLLCFGYNKEKKIPRTILEQEKKYIGKCKKIYNFEYSERDLG